MSCVCKNLLSLTNQEVSTERVYSVMPDRTATKIAPFPFQRECADIIKKASVSKQKTLIAIASGFGHTAIINLALRELLETKNIRRVLIVCPRNVLLYQFHRSFSEDSLRTEKLRPSSLGSQGTKSKVQFDDAPILLSSLVAFRKLVKRFPSDSFDMIFFDECQSLSLKDWETAGKLESTLVGFTSIHPSLISSSMR